MKGIIITAINKLNILQAVRRRESIIVTDPKCELYYSAASHLQNKGYTVKVFNLAD